MTIESMAGTPAAGRRSGPIDSPTPPGSTTSGADGGQSGTSGSTSSLDDGSTSGSGTTGSTTADTGSSDSTGGVCAVDERDDPCLQCARTSCCEELELCAGQTECTCFIDCLRSQQDAMRCQMQCEPSSGMAAMAVCLAMACPGLCE